jgi:hypothetical protein
MDRPGPADALERIACQLRQDDTLIAARLGDPAAHRPTLGLLAAAGPRARGVEGDYSFVIEAIREGYLLHYGESRLVAGADRDLALLAGDYLYALGLEQLAALGDLDAVGELADLISLVAQVHAEAPGPSEARERAEALWIAAVIAAAAGPSPAHEGAKAALRAGDPNAPIALRAAARETAEVAGMAAPLASASDE